MRRSHWIECDTCTLGDVEIFEDENRDVNMIMYAALKNGWTFDKSGKWSCSKCNQAPGKSK